MALALAVSSYTIYNTACMLVEHMGPSYKYHNEFFNATLFRYLFIITTGGILVSGLLQVLFTRRVVNPLNDLLESTKLLQKGMYPEPIRAPKNKKDELGQLITQFNELIHQLESNATERKKLISDLSHEIRTPLTNVSGYLKAMESGVIEGSPEVYRSLLNETGRVTAMIEQLDHLAALDNQLDEDEPLVPVKVEEAVHRSQAAFRAKREEKQIEMEVDVERAVVKAVEKYVEQIVANFLDNAIRYYEGNGSITIRGEQQSDAYRLEVCGPSQTIREEDVPHLFDRLYRVDPSRSDATGGRGLGLAIAKEMTTRWEGDIGYERKGDDNCFYVTFPNRHE